MLALGSNGEEVKELQSSLNEEDYGPLVVDGLFGAATDSAVRRFQADRGLAVDGIVGPTTLAALEAKTAEPPPPRHVCYKLSKMG